MSRQLIFKMDGAVSRVSSLALICFVLMSSNGDSSAHPIAFQSTIERVTLDKIFKQKENAVGLFCQKFCSHWRTEIEIGLQLSRLKGLRFLETSMASLAHRVTKNHTHKATVVFFDRGDALLYQGRRQNAAPEIAEFFVSSVYPEAREFHASELDERGRARNNDRDWIVLGYEDSCRQLVPAWHALAYQYKRQISVGLVNVNENPEFKLAHNWTNCPHIFMQKNKTAELRELPIPVNLEAAINLMEEVLHDWYPNRAKKTKGDKVIALRSKLNSGVGKEKTAETNVKAAEQTKQTSPQKRDVNELKHKEFEQPKAGTEEVKPSKNEDDENHQGQEEKHVEESISQVHEKDTPEGTEHGIIENPNDKMEDNEIDKEKNIKAIDPNTPIKQKKFRKKKNKKHDERYTRDAHADIQNMLYKQFEKIKVSTFVNAQNPIAITFIVIAVLFVIILFIFRKRRKSNFYHKMK